MEATDAGALIANRYELGSLLRRGGMADVHAGVDRRLQRPVAIKLLRPGMADRPDVRARFEAEARAAAQLTHPCAVAVFDTGEHAGTPYIVMERLPGRTLADLIADGPVEPEWLLPAAAGVLSALGAAHAAGIVHRDVKPGNILLTDTGTAKIADFGIAKSAELASGALPGTVDLTATGHVIGTAAYLAPERLAGAPATFLSDIYSMGVVLYEALAGEKPYTGPSFVAVAQAVQEGRHRPLVEVRPGVDRATADAVERAMDRDPSRRFPSAEAMADALTGRTEPPTTAIPVMARGEETTVLATDAVAATQETDAAPLPLATRRRRLSLLVPLALAAALFVGLLILLGGGGSSPTPASSTTPTTVATTTPPEPSTTPTSAVPSQGDTVERTTPPREAPRNRKGRKGGGNKD